MIADISAFTSNDPAGGATCLMTSLVTHARPGWVDAVPALHPGSHLAVFGDNADVGIEGRLAGLELRDTLLVLRAGPTASFIFLFRVPVAEPTVADQMAATATGALHVDACRIATAEDRGRPRGTFPHSDDSWGNGHLACTQSHRLGRWPPNVVLMHGRGCRTATGCEPDCPVSLLGDPARFYPQFEDEHALRARIGRLLTPTSEREPPVIGRSAWELIRDPWSDEKDAAEEGDTP